MLPLNRLSANCALLFPDLPLLDRARAAADAGLLAVEFWWPFASAKPTAQEIDAFIAAVVGSGVTLSAMNLYAGDMPGGERGVLSHSSRLSELLGSLDAVRAVAEATGVSQFNALYGRAVPGLTADQQAQDAVAALGAVQERLDGAGTVLLEPVSGVPDFPLTTFSQCVAVRDAALAAGVPQVGVLADLYHLATNGDDVTDVVEHRAQDVAHVQIADSPGRHEPGTGELPIARWVAALIERGYDGWIGLEYNPVGDTAAGLAGFVAE